VICMDRKIRVLIVDDSVVIRRMLADALAADSRFEIAGVAANGQIALSVLSRTAVDIVTLDVDMPVMDGLETLKQIRTRHSHLPVIMFSTLTERCAQITIDALALGASDYATKPSNVGSITAAHQQILESLIPKMLSLCGYLKRGEPGLRATAQPAAPAVRLRKQTQLHPIEIVAIGSSTGGPNALAEVLRALPADFPVPVVIAQHMPPAFTRFLSQRLNAMTSLDVREAIAGVALEPGQVSIAPGDYHLCVVRDCNKVRLALSQSPPENSCRPSVEHEGVRLAATLPVHLGRRPEQCRFWVQYWMITTPREASGWASGGKMTIFAGGSVPLTGMTVVGPQVSLCFELASALIASTTTATATAAEYRSSLMI